MRRVNVGHNVFRWRLVRGFVHPAFARRPKAWKEPEPVRERVPPPVPAEKRLPRVEKKVAPEAPKKKELTRDQFLLYQSLAAKAKRRQLTRKANVRRAKDAVKVTTSGVRSSRPAWATRRREIRDWGADVVRARRIAREEALARASQEMWQAAAEARKEISRQEARSSAREEQRKVTSRLARKTRQDRKIRRERREELSESRKERWKRMEEFRDLMKRKALGKAVERMIPIGLRPEDVKRTIPEDVKRWSRLEFWKDIVGADPEAEHPRGWATPFQSIQVQNLRPFTGLVKHTDYTVVGDWNFRTATAEQPMLIRVPGRAPLFREPQDKLVTVPPDEKEGWIRMRRENSILTQTLLAARYMGDYSKKRIYVDDVDIIATRSVMEQLVYFCSDIDQKTARLNLHMVGSSLYVTRPYVENEGPIFTKPVTAGYGRNYEKAVTKSASELRDCPEHMRAIKYKIGNVTCLVQSQVDAYWVEDEKNYMPRTTYKKVYANQDIVVETATAAGYLAPPRVGTAEIKTRSNSVLRSHTEEQRRINHGDNIRQTWFGRATYLIHSYQIYGQFSKAQVTQTSKAWREWEEENQVALQRLVSLLEEMRMCVKRKKGRSCAVLLKGPNRSGHRNKAQFFEMEDQELAASEELIKEFWPPGKPRQAILAAQKKKKWARRRLNAAGLKGDNGDRVFRKQFTIGPVDHAKSAIARARESGLTDNTSKTDMDEKSRMVTAKKVPPSQQNGKPAPKSTKTTPGSGPTGGQKVAATKTSGNAKRPNVPIKADWGQRNVAVAEKKARQADAAKMAKAMPAARGFKAQPPKPKPKPAASAGEGWPAALGPVPGAGPKR